MTGIGGGSLMTPMLILVFGVQPVTAIGTDLAYAAVTKTVGGYKHLRQKTVDLTLSSWMALGSVPAAIGGVYVLSLLEEWAGRDFEDLVIAILAGALLLTGSATLVRAFLKRMHERERDTIAMERRHKVAAVVLGVCVGFVLGVTSAGSGALIAVGWFTRPAAFLASGTMAVAYFYAHFPKDFFPLNNGGDAAILYSFLFFYLIFRGPGALSVDGDKRAVEVTEAERL